MKKALLLSFVIVLLAFAGKAWASHTFLARGSMSEATSQMVIIVTSEIELQQVRSLFLPGLREELNVDFEREVAVFAFGGRCPSAGYHVEIDGLTYCGKKVDLSMRTERPDGGFFAQVVTSPWVVVTVVK